MRTLLYVTLATVLVAGATPTFPALAATTSCSGPFMTAADIASQLGGQRLHDTAPTYNEIMPSNMAGAFSEVGNGTTTTPESPNYGTVSVAAGNGSTTDFSNAAKVTYAYKSGYTSPALAVVDSSPGNSNKGPYQFCSGSGALFTASIKN